MAAAHYCWRTHHITLTDRHSSTSCFAEGGESVRWQNAALLRVPRHDGGTGRLARRLRRGAGGDRTHSCPLRVRSRASDRAPPDRRGEALQSSHSMTAQPVWTAVLRRPLVEETARRGVANARCKRTGRCPAWLHRKLSAPMTADVPHPTRYSRKRWAAGVMRRTFAGAGSDTAMLTRISVVDRAGDYGALSNAR